jgi:hypothetical protein
MSHSRPERRSLDSGDVRDALLDGQSVELLQALGLVTPRGGASPSANRKIKQITHFARLVAPALDDAFARHEDPVLVDFGAGKAYLGLVLYELWMHRHGRGRLIAVEARPELCDRVRRIADQRGFTRVDVAEGDIATAALPDRTHVALALHACDTATDDAIVRALQTTADHVAMAPCCQAEVARLLKKTDVDAVDALWAHSLHRREFGAHLTNVIRGLVLQANGYQVTVTELVGWEHAVKNELIVGRRVGRFHRGASARLDALLATISVAPALIERVARLQSAGSTTSDGAGGSNDTQA